MKYIPIYEKFLMEGQRLQLRWNEGWTFHRVLGVQRWKVAPFMYGFSLVSAGSTQDFTEFTDSNNNRLFNVTDTHAANLMYHVGIGIKPKILRVYVKYPSGIDLRPILSFDPVSLGLGFNSQRGYFTGVDSPYNGPTDAMEYFFPYTLDVTFGIVNPDTVRPHQPVFSIEGATYFFETFQPDVSSAKEIIRRMVRGQVSRRMYTLGPPERPKSFGLKHLWNVDPVKFEDVL